MMFCRILLPLLFPLLIALAACGGDGGGSETPSPTGPPTAPTDWPTYTDPDGLFSVRYPPDWTRDGGSFYMPDPATIPSIPPEGFPPDVIKVETGYYPVWGYSCGNLTLDPETGDVIDVPPELVETKLDGQQAWRSNGVSTLDHTTWIMGVAAVYGDTCFHLIAYDSHEDGDYGYFDQIVSSFTYDFTPPDEWPTYTTPDGRVSLIYPPDWEAADGVIYADDSSPDGVRIEISVEEARGLEVCGGAIGLNTTGYYDSFDPQASEMEIDGEATWRLDRDDPESDGMYITEYDLLHEGYCVVLASHFADEGPGYWTIEQVEHSFALNF